MKPAYTKDDKRDNENPSGKQDHSVQENAPLEGDIEVRDFVERLKDSMQEEDARITQAKSLKDLTGAYRALESAYQQLDTAKRIISPNIADIEKGRSILNSRLEALAEQTAKVSESFFTQFGIAYFEAKKDTRKIKEIDAMLDEYLSLEQIVLHNSGILHARKSSVIATPSRTFSRYARFAAQTGEAQRKVHEFEQKYSDNPPLTKVDIGRAKKELKDISRTYRYAKSFLLEDNVLKEARGQDMFRSLNNELNRLSKDLEKTAESYGRLRKAREQILKEDEGIAAAEVTTKIDYLTWLMNMPSFPKLDEETDVQYRFIRRSAQDLKQDRAKLSEHLNKRIADANALLEQEFRRDEKRIEAGIKEIAHAEQYVQKFSILKNEEYMQRSAAHVRDLQERTAEKRRIAEINQRAGTEKEEAVRKAKEAETRARYEAEKSAAKVDALKEGVKLGIEEGKNTAAEAMRETVKTLGEAVAEGVKTITDELKGVAGKIIHPPPYAESPSAPYPLHPKPKSAGTELIYSLEQMEERPTNPGYIELSDIILGKGRWRNEALICRIDQLTKTCSMLPLPSTVQDRTYINKIYEIVGKSVEEGVLNNVAELSDENSRKIQKAYSELKTLANPDEKNRN